MAPIEFLTRLADYIFAYLDKSLPTLFMDTIVREIELFGLSRSSSQRENTESRVIG